MNQQDQKMTKCEPAFHVAPSGNDNADGSYSAPFRTVEKALEAARTSAGIKTVMIHEGIYMTKGLTLTSADAGMTFSAYGDDKVTLCGGVSLNGEDFFKPSADFLDRLTDQSVREKIYCVDLKRYGLTKNEWGNLHATGTCNRAAAYEGDYVGSNCEVFVNDKRQTLARWPNEGYLKLEGVTDEGGGKEKGAFGGIYNVGKETADRIAGWKDPTSAWIFGCFRYNWADASSPIASFDAQAGTITPLFSSYYGVDIDAAVYYYYNIPEELDVPGEYYLDRENGFLYLCMDTDPKNADILFSYRNKNLIESEADNVTFRGLTLLGVCGNGIRAKGNGNLLDSLTVKNVAGLAVSVIGTDNTVQYCDISHTGKGGIMLSGGSRETLTHAHNLAHYNYIHDWSEVYITYQAGIALYGVGNTASHNELVNTPHEAITFGGNDNVVEYNYIHNTCLLSDDAGAIYCGRDWSAYGNIIRYNIVAGVGDAAHHPNGIYLDDAISGIEVYGNIVFAHGHQGMLIGGGRSNRIRDNIVINTARAITYDERARDGFFNDGWYRPSVIDTENGLMWTGLRTAPYQSRIWTEKYPELGRIKDTYEDQDDPDFAPNPAYGEVSGNLFFSNLPADIGEYVCRYGAVKDNGEYAYDTYSQWFADAENGDFTFLKPDEMPRIPVGEIGRGTKKRTDER